MKAMGVVVGHDARHGSHRFIYLSDLVVRSKECKQIGIFNTAVSGNNVWWIFVVKGWLATNLMLVVLNVIYDLLVLSLNFSVELLLSRFLISVLEK